MFCGSCMHDNTWARALNSAGMHVTLIPTYTPIRVDEEDISTARVFFGGINIYLDYRYRFWRKLPRWLTGWLDSPWVIRLATRFGVSNDARDLGGLTLAMLEGELGPQKTLIDELSQFLANDLKPDVICFSNALLSGAVRTIKRETGRPVLCVLQGDDIFLDNLIEPYRGKAIDMLRERVREIDGFLVHSAYYRDFMSDYLQIPADRFHLQPLGIDLEGHDGQPTRDTTRPFTVGYFARICPEKGLLPLVEAFRLLHERHPQVQLLAGGYLPPEHLPYYREVQRAAEPIQEAFRYVGSPETKSEKVHFFKSIDVLSVPTVYREPKGLYVLESLANGVPVVQPAHGSFPELIEQTGGGLLVPPGDAAELAAGLERLLQDPELRMNLGTQGQQSVREKFNSAEMTRRSVELLQQFASD